MRILVHICCGPCAIAVLERLLEKGHDVTALFFNPNIHPLAEYMRRREGAGIVSARLGVPLIFADALDESEQNWPHIWPGIFSAQNNAPAVPEAAPAAGAGALPQNHGKKLPLPLAANPALWLRAVSGHEDERCEFCWQSRLAFTASTAARLGFAAFTSSLLYSRYQNHEKIRTIGEILAEHGNACGTAAAGADSGNALSGTTLDATLGTTLDATSQSSAASTGAHKTAQFYYEDFRPLWQHGIQRSKDWGIYRQQYCGCMFSEYDRYARDYAVMRGAIPQNEKKRRHADGIGAASN